MQIRMKTTVSGSRNGVPWPPRGETVELPDDEATALCASGMAEPVEHDEEASEAIGDEETRPAPDDDVEKRTLTTQTAAAVTPGAGDSQPKTLAKQAAPAKKTAAKKTTAAPAKD
ncbi:hypothetical protein [Streptomyces cylindrosporus]|uniref:Uncharacterized protein n=1 Tax=Streptomyces cylindrosporus TaxID=2927583 RepID=A0ABS9YJV1_9ACTN|nr:hypothetical protein [Streptomyces cylindrosporus]MCI3277522.1 hypothetical protein [Streptomyces cylindrosporus]